MTAELLALLPEKIARGRKQKRKRTWVHEDWCHVCKVGERA